MSVNYLTFVEKKWVPRAPAENGDKRMLLQIIILCFEEKVVLFINWSYIISVVLLNN